MVGVRIKRGNLDRDKPIQRKDDINAHEKKKKPFASQVIPKTTRSWERGID